MRFYFGMDYYNFGPRNSYWYHKPFGEPYLLFEYNIFKKISAIGIETTARPITENMLICNGNVIFIGMDNCFVKGSFSKKRQATGVMNSNTSRLSTHCTQWMRRNFVSYLEALCLNLPLGILHFYFFTFFKSRVNTLQKVLELKMLIQTIAFKTFWRYLPL